MNTGFVTFAAALVASAFSFAAPASAAIDKELVVNVYQLCNTAGTSCASRGPEGNEFFAAETNEIWSQAGIKVTFNFVQKLFYDDVYNIDDSDFWSSFDRLSTSTYNPSGVQATSLFLVNSINASPGSITYGEASQGGPGLAIAMSDVMSFNGGAGRADTIAHELGHNLGLVPVFGGHSPNFYELMAAGSNRCVPGAACANPLPDGITRLDYLPQTHVDIARQSALLTDIAPVPEPGEWAMMIAGLGVVGFVATRRRAA